MLKLLVKTGVVASLLLFVTPIPAQIQGSWVNTGSMTSVRESGVQVGVGSEKALVAGGTNGTSVLASAEIYNSATGVWTATGNMATAREYAAAVVLNSGKVLIVGGLDGGNHALASAELYDFSTSKWSPAGTLAKARFAHTATLLQSGKVLVAGGCAANPCSSYLADTELYDPVANKWTTTGGLLTARAFHTATLLHSGEVLVVAGGNGSPLNICELYDPSTGKWRYASGMTYARVQHAATLLQSGKVLVTGGRVSRYPMSSAEVYDASANTWTLTGSMTMGRYAHTATLLGDSTVLVAGGIGQPISCGKACTGYIPTARAEIYNEAAGKFAASASLTRAQAYHSTTLLGTGRALADGGMGNTSICCVPLSTAEIYTPLTLKFSASSLNFGFRQVGLPSLPQMVSVTNVSFHSATFSSIASSGDFAQNNNCPSTLNPTQSCTITITFKPTSTGVRNGGVTLKDNSPGSPQQTISATGTGAPYEFALTPNSLQFPGIIPGNSSPALPVTILNDSATQVSITGISISPADGTFTETHNCPTMLQPGQSCTVQIVFTPPDSISYGATLLVTDSAKHTQTASLAGTGLD